MDKTAKPDTAINLLVVDSSLNDTEMYASTLRNAGLAIHVIRVDTEAALEQALADEEADVILCSSDVEDLDVASVTARVSDTGTDMPLIVISANREPDLILEAMHNGARDIVARDDLEHLQLVVNREFGDLRVRRRLRALEATLEETDERFTVLIENSRDAIAYIHEGMHMRANPVYLEMFGYVDMEELEGLPILDMVAVDHHQEFKKFLRELAKDGTLTAEKSVSCVTSDGTTFDAVMEFAPATIEGEPCTQIIIRDQTKSKELESKLKDLTHKDMQTGLANRQYFLQSLEEAVADTTWSGGSRSIVYVTLDNFPELRASAGISASDAVLAETAKLLEGLAEDGDLLARFGDHSFAILKVSDAKDATEKLATSICETVENHVFESAATYVSPTCSIGIATLDDTVSGAQDIINHAIQASENAASEGGCKYAFYEPKFSAAEGESSGDRIRKLIDFSLANGRFRLAFQPVVSLEGDTTENYAVMVRLVDNEDNEVLPVDFMPEAKESGQMADIDRWVLQNALETLGKERQEGKKVSFFVTLSGNSLDDDSLLLWICDCLKEAKVQGQWITFQIADNDVRNHLQKAKALMEGLKKINCSIAIAAFGINPKSEGLIKHLPVDFVKFDASFSKDLATSQEKQDNMNRMNEMVQSHGVKSVATGVEDANSMAILWTVGVNYMQGYFLQEPTESLSYDFGS
jgi:diguanylate cyclase (GGDEF)-like protein/PAS domain S-box-containing protein